MRLNVLEDLTYATVGEIALTLDLYLPLQPATRTVVLYLHGGGYRQGDKADDKNRLLALAEHGIAVASANYRLVPHAAYPAPVHDAKAAVRWLRANGPEHGLVTASVGVWGASAGGYLASMLGLTAHDPTLEGAVGPHLRESSAVQAVVSWFAPSDLVAQSRRTWLEQQILPEPAEHGLFGRDHIPNDDELVQAASPLHRAHSQAPPFLIASGDRDRMVAEHQSRALHDALALHGVDVTHSLLGGAGHEDPKFDTRANIASTAGWLHSQLSGSATPAQPPHPHHRLTVMSDVPPTLEQEAGVHA